MQKLRSTALEGIIGQAKSLYGMDRAKFRGLKKVEIQLLLTATAINLKKMVNMLETNELETSILRVVSRTCRFIKNILEKRLNNLTFLEA